MQQQSQNTLPPSFKPLLWSYDFNSVDPLRDKKTIIVNTINYGDLTEWRWLARFYGKEEIQDMLGHMRPTEIRPRALRLASLLFSNDSLYAS